MGLHAGDEPAFAGLHVLAELLHVGGAGALLHVPLAACRASGLAGFGKVLLMLFHAVHPFAGLRIFAELFHLRTAGFAAPGAHRLAGALSPGSAPAFSSHPVGLAVRGQFRFMRREAGYDPSFSRFYVLAEFFLVRPAGPVALLRSGRPGRE